MTLAPLADGLAAAPTVIQALTGGATYGLAFYVKARWADPHNPESFDAVSFGTTLALSGALGVVLELAGVSLQFSHVVAVLLTFGGAIAFLEAAIVAALRGNRARARAQLEQAARETAGVVLSGSDGGPVTSPDVARDELEKRAQDAREMDDEQLRSEWRANYPDAEASAQVDDEEEVDETRRFWSSQTVSPDDERGA